MPDVTTSSDQASELCAYQARWIVPISRPPIENGVVAVRAGKIVFAGESRTWDDSVIELGDVAILPGLVNAHTHLEFSELPRPFGQRGDAFAKWIPQVVAHRRARLETRQAENVELGLAESRAHGVALLGEIATADSWPQTAADGLSGRVFQEFLGWDRQKIPELRHKARNFLADAQPGVWQRGLSPHAPYTVHRDLLAALCDIASEHNAPLAMHIAESPAEMEFLATGLGPLRAMLEAAGVWHSDFWEQPLTTRHFLEQLARAKRSLVIHGNQFAKEDWDFLSERRERMSVVYCPRTRDFFFPEQKYPLEQMLACGIAMAVGTDSRASNPDLSLWRELQYIAEHHNIAPEQILRLGTEHGARALGYAHSHGRLEPGYSGELCVIRNIASVGSARGLATQLLLPESYATGL
jgi:aminodeoxyfutalosine deaminase